MEGLLRNIPPQVSKEKLERLHSDSVGSHLKDKDESEHLNNFENTAPAKKQKLKFKQVNYIATHNINSLLQIGKLKTLTDILKQQKILICALQEMRNFDQEPMETQGFRMYKGIPGKRAMRNVPQFGTGFIVDLRIADSIVDFQAVNPRLAILTIKASNKIYTLINAHTPTNDKNQRLQYKEETEEFWNQLDLTLNNIPKNHTKILIGDFNAQLGKERKFKDIIGKWPAQRNTNKNGERLIEVCRNHKLISKSTYFMRKPSKLKTWKHPDWKKGEWQLDHVCADKTKHKEIQNVKVLRGIDTGSDHYLIKIKIKFTPNRTIKGKQNITKRYDPSKLIKNEKYKSMTQQIKSKNLKELTDKLTQIAENVASPNPRKKHMWWNEECDKAFEERHQAWINHQNKKTEESQEHFKKIRKQTSKTFRQTKRQFEKDRIQQIEEYSQNPNSRYYFQTFKQSVSKYEPNTLLLKGPNGKTAHSNKENTEILKNTFDKLLNCEEPASILNIDMNTPIKSTQAQINPPTITELKKALSEMKNYKSGGEDTVTTEIWNNASDETIKNLHKHVVKIWESEKLEEKWTTAMIHPLYKKGERNNPDNYRGISLLDCTYKIFSRIIYNKIKDQLEKELGEYQGGFRPWRGCPDQILTLKLIMQYYKKQNKQLVIAFIDFKKAYDSIHRITLLRILRNLGLHPKLVKMIELTLTNTKSKIKFRGELSEEFEIKTGLRQGDGLSPILFNCALEYIMREWEMTNPKNIQIGYRKENIKLNCLGFADDLAFLANKVAETKTQITSLEEIANKIGLKISYEKTKLMIIDPLCIDKIKINGNNIAIVEKFKYLGETITYNLNERPAWEDRINKLLRGQQITKNVYNKKSLSIHTKLRHYKAVIIPQITYGSETLQKVEGQGIKEKLRKMERRILRTIINKKNIVDGQHRILPNDQIYSRIEPITNTMRKRKISFLAHILRMPEDRLLRKIILKFLNTKSTNNRIPWINETEQDIKELGLTMEDIKNRTPHYKNTMKDQNKILTNKERRTGKQNCSDEVRKARSDRMKKYWAEKTQKKLKYQPKRLK